MSLAKPQLPLPRGRIRTLSGTIPPVGYCPKWGGPTMYAICALTPIFMGFCAIFDLKFHFCIFID
jgi:hypothetical protein